MKHILSYDITRLITRILNSTPNGIDRLDLAYAKHFLSDAMPQNTGMVHFGPFGHRSITGATSRMLVEAINQHFGEDSGDGQTVTTQAVMNWVNNPESPKPLQKRRKKSRFSYWRVADFYLRNRGNLGGPPEKNLPLNARYLCVSQYPLSEASAFRWMEHRRDVKAVFFLHDMLPIQFPEYFKPLEKDRHIQRLKNVAQYASGLLVSTQDVKVQLVTSMKEFGRLDIPIHVSPVPLAPPFLKSYGTRTLNSQPYFVVCGTIEPRKNHLLLLNVWREIAMILGTNTPKLILVGARGWENENILDMLDRSPLIREHVLEFNGLSTPELVHLIRGSRAVLMPTFGEGFGLPVAEAMALGVPLVASDIPVFREITGGRATLLSPLNGERWKQVISDIAQQSAADQRPTGQFFSKHVNMDLSDVESFMNSL